MRIKTLLLISLPILFITTSCKEKKSTGWVRTQDAPSESIDNTEKSRWIASTRKTADQLYEAGYYLAAYKQYESLSKYVANDGELYYKRAFCKFYFGKAEESRADYFKAINLGYKQSASYYRVGLTYLDENDSLAALYMEKALSIEPEHVRAKMLLSKLKESLKRGEKFDITKMDLHEPS